MLSEVNKHQLPWIIIQYYGEEIYFQGRQLCKNCSEKLKLAISCKTVSRVCVKSQTLSFWKNNLKNTTNLPLAEFAQRVVRLTIKILKLKLPKNHDFTVIWRCRMCPDINRYLVIDQCPSSPIIIIIIIHITLLYIIHSVIWLLIHGPCCSYMLQQHPLSIPLKSG